MNAKKVLGVVVLVVALCVAVCALAARRALGESGGANPVGLNPLTYLSDQTTTAFRSTTSAVDSLTTSGVTATPKFYTTDNTAGPAPYLSHGIRKNLGVCPRFQASGDTVTVQLAYCHWNGSTEVVGSWSAPVTLTAGTTLLESSYYVAPEYVFDTHGADVIHVLLVTFNPAAGHQVTTWCRSW